MLTTKIHERAGASISGNDPRSGSQAAPDTFFAPADRAGAEQLDALVNQIINEPVVNTVLQTMDGLLVILNPQRQILSANQTLLQTLGVDLADCLGKRPGEAFECIHHNEGPGGCGTSKKCSQCGAVLTILAAQARQGPVDGECWMTRKVGDSVEAAEFRVRSAPIKVRGNTVYSFVLNDISAVKRRDALERVFLHDITNLIGGLLGCVDLCETGLDDEVKTMIPMFSTLIKRLSREIESHKILLEAEQGDLEVKSGTVKVLDLFSTLSSIFQEHEVARAKKLVIKAPHSNYTLVTDFSLLLRVLTNMIKNALEAVDEGGVVTVSFTSEDGRATFYVHNPGEIPEKDALQIFQRSFSTKSGAGRGLGTYSMKLLGETYLKGKVDFTSTPEQGVTFYISFPME